MLWLMSMQNTIGAELTIVKHVKAVRRLGKRKRKIVKKIK
jgi:hypothetical protein